MTEAWIAFRNFVERTEDLPVGFLVRGACARGLDDEAFAAYEAPFPTPASKAGHARVPADAPDDARRAGRRRGPARCSTR